MMSQDIRGLKSCHTVNAQAVGVVKYKLMAQIAAT